MWQTIFAWPWATIWAAISAIFTAATVGIAFCAMKEWKKQEQFKAKVNFKSAVAKYAYCLVALPSHLSPPGTTRDNPAKIDELTDLLAEAAFAWFSLEGSLVDNKHVTESWLFINDNHIRYVDGEISYHEIHTHCANIVTKPINKK